MKRIKYLSLILACLMALSCMTALGASAASAEQEPYTFTYYKNYDWSDTSYQWGDDMVSSVLTDMFNTTVKLAKPDIDPAQKMGIMIAGNDLPDCMMIERDAIYNQLIDLDMLLPLDEFIENDSRYAQVVEKGTIDMARINGKSYGLLNFATQKDHALSNNGFAINKKIWEQLGSPALDTTDDLYNYLMAVKEAEIKVEGQSVIPLQFFTGNWMVNLITNSFGIYANEGVTPIDGHLKMYLNDPRTVEAFKYMNKLWNAGLVNSDYFIEKSEQVTEKLMAGRVAVYAGNDITNPSFNQARLTLMENDPGNDYIVIHPPAGPGVNQADIANNLGSTMGWNVIVITKAAKDPERIFQLLDYNVSPEGACLSVYGPKGELYDELDEQGYPILKQPLANVSAEESKRLGLSKWTLLGNTMFMDLAKVADNNRKPADEKDWITEAQANYTYQHAVNDDALVVGMAPDPQEPEGIAYTAFRQLNEKYIPKIIMAKSEDECLAAIQEAINDIYSQGFELTEAFKDGVYQQNLAKLGQ